MELARDYCNETRVAGGVNTGGAFYDVRRNRCYAICETSIIDTASQGKNTFRIVTLSDVHTNEPLASYMEYWNAHERDYGEIGGKLTSRSKAKAYIKRMTTE